MFENIPKRTGIVHIFSCMCGTEIERKSRTVHKRTCGECQSPLVYNGVRFNR